MEVVPIQNEEEKKEIILSTSEFFAISRLLEQHHAVFYQFWELGKPTFTRKIPTAAVEWDKTGICINFLFNPDFWLKLTPTQRNFVICHECLHVILKHGIRGKDCKRHSVANKSMDVVINHMLIEQFGYSRKEIDPDNKYCWLDTVFKDNPNILINQSFEYYYNELKKISDELLPTNILVDMHGFNDGGFGDTDADGDEESESDEGEGSSNESEEKNIDDILEKIAEKLSNEEKETLKAIFAKDIEEEKKKQSEKRGLLAGSDPLGEWLNLSKKKIKKKRKWETVIKKWMKRYLPNDFDMYEQWTKTNRRWTTLPDDIHLPCEIEMQEKEEKRRIQVYFFLDTSGSCSHLADRFWTAANSLPVDRFEARLFSFDCKVYPISDEDRKQQRIRGGGGTNFGILEDQIQKDIKAETIHKYPEAVFVISDGHGSSISPKCPKQWYWFLTARHYKYIPETSNKYLLANFE